MPSPTEPQWPRPAPLPLRQLQHGDWFCGKSVGLVVIKISGIVFNVYVTHVSAPGKDPAWGDEEEEGDEWPYPSFAVPLL